MATQTVEFQAASGLTITAKLFSPGSDAEVASASATERTNDKGTYTVGYTDVPAGTYRLKALAGSLAAATWETTLTLTTATFQAYEPTSVRRMGEDVIRAEAFDESTAFPLKSADAGSTAVARTGADSDTLETISDQLDAIASVAGGGVLHATTIATLTSQTEFTLTAGSADDGTYNDTTIVVVDQSTSTQIAVAYVANYVGATKTIKLLQSPGFTIAAGDSIKLITGMDTARVHVEAQLTNGAGDAAHVAAWLEWRGQRVGLTGDTITVAFRRIDQDANAFAITESDVIGAATATYENTFRMYKGTPGFTDDRIYVVTATITHNGRAFVGTEVLSVLGT